MISALNFSTPHNNTYNCNANPHKIADKYQPSFKQNHDEHKLLKWAIGASISLGLWVGEVAICNHFINNDTISATLGSFISTAVGFGLGGFNILRLFTRVLNPKV